MTIGSSTVTLRGLQNNPIYRRLRRPPGWIVWAISAAIALILVPALSALVASAAAATGVAVVVSILPGAANILRVMVLLVLAATGGLMVARDVATEDYQMVRLTALTPPRIVLGYLAAILHRLAPLLAAALLMSLGAQATWYFLLLPTLSSIRLESFVPVGIGVGLFVVSYVLSIWVTATLSVWYGMLLREPPWAAIAAAVTVIVVAVGSSLAQLGLQSVVIRFSAGYLAMNAFFFGIAIVGMLLQLGIGAAAFWLAQRQA